MKVLNLFVAAVMMLSLAACSGGGYSAEKCEQLKEKVQNREELSEGDYDDMIDQVVACAKAVKEKADAAKGNQEMEDQLRNDKEFTDMMGYALTFGFYLQSHQKDLSDSNLKKLEAAEADIRSLQ